MTTPAPLVFLVDVDNTLLARMTSPSSGHRR
jgi:hypothetical protein